MKLVEKTDYPGGWCINILKFKSRSVIEMSFETSPYKSLPSFLLQIGPDDVFYMSIGIHKYIFSKTVWGKHYDD